MYFFHLVALLLVIGAKLNSAKEIYKREGDFNVAVLIQNECNSTATITEYEQSLINGAIWTMHQINISEVIPQVTLGLNIFKICNLVDEYDALFELFKKKKEGSLLGLVTSSAPSWKIQKFTEAVDLNIKETMKCILPLIETTVALLDGLNWIDNITVIAPNKNIISDFFKISITQAICVKDFIIYDSLKSIRELPGGHLVIFGTHDFFKKVIKTFDVTNTILVPLDVSSLNELPDNTYLISTFDGQDRNYFSTTPQVFEIAAPIVTYAQDFKSFLRNCNQSALRSCLRNLNCKNNKLLEPARIMDLLKIEPASINYFVYKSENSSFLQTKVFVYNTFSNNLTQLSNIELDNASHPMNCKFDRELCQNSCQNYIFSKDHFDFQSCVLRVRTEPWIFAFLSLSLLGVLLCIAILIFLLVSVCRRTTLEGNPVMTLLLLFTVMLIYASVLPIAIGNCRTTNESVCLARALLTTLSISAAFSLILSRCILLATSSKEIGFMSHIPGVVQSFLSLFIFGVQAALSLNIITHCHEIFKGISFIYLLSYNVMLLLLLLCLSPLIFKSSRNYKEGKYYTISAIIISVLWAFWLPVYGLVEDQSKDFVLCFGLVSTASTLLGTIFIPRTYLMTIAAARDKMTSTIPSLAAATSAMDIYRAGTQPVYDCVNVAAINAVTVARAGLTTIQQPDLYSCPTLPDEPDYEMSCDTPVVDDKVTRF